MSVTMSFHLLVETRDFDELRGVVAHLFSGLESELDRESLSVIAAIGPRSARHTWLTIDDQLSQGVNFYGTLSNRPPAARWWEFATTDGALTFVAAYSADDGRDRWDSKGKAGLARAAKDAQLEDLALPDRETGELDGTTALVLAPDEPWEHDLAKALGVPAKQRPPRKVTAVRRDEEEADAWNGFDRSDRILADPRAVLAAAPAKPSTLADELDRLECLWRVGKRTEAKAGFAKLRLSGDAAVRLVHDVTSPMAWTNVRERYLPDFSLALLEALPRRLQNEAVQLRRAQALAALGDKRLIPTLKALFSTGVPSSLSWDVEIAESVGRMKKGPLAKEAKRLVQSLRPPE